MTAESKKITVRANGKCHPAVQHPGGAIMISCRCPNSQNGRLANVATKVADGWEKANCGK